MKYQQYILFKATLLIMALIYSGSVLAQDHLESEKSLNITAKTENPSEWINLHKSECIKKDLFVKKIFTSNELDTNNKLIQKSKKSDELGWTHYRMQQTYKTIPIEGADYIMHERNGLVEKSNGTLVKNLNQSIVPSISDAKALQLLLTSIAATKYAWEDEPMEEMLKDIKQDSKASYCPKGELVFVSPDFRGNASEQKLAYKFDVFSIEPYDRNYYYVDAHTGEIINKITRIHHNDFTGSAKTNYYGIQPIKTTFSNGYYRLKEYERGNGIETYNSNNTWAHPDIDFLDSDNVWEDDTKTGCEAHWGSEKVYDYFKNKHGRDSFDGLGAKIQSWVHYGVNYVNAFWNGSYMTYGDGNGSSYGPLTCLDVVGHEITHAITERTAGLIYAYESGALNESFSDIFGTVIEFEAEPTASERDWYMGEDANITGTGFRNMSNPNAKNHPDTYKGDFWYTGSGDNGGVHYNSGVQNFWFYLLTEGGSGTNDNGDAYQVTGIGMDKAAKIAFRNLTVNLTPNSNYLSAALGSIEAAKDIYGTTSNEVEQVRNAWCAVGVGSCVPLPTGELTITYPNGGEVWITGDQETITWNSTGNVGPYVKLEISYNGGASWFIRNASTANDGSYLLNVPNVITSLAKYRLSSTTNTAIFDESDESFAIENPPPPAPTCNAESIELGPDVYLPTGGTITLSTGLDHMAYYIWDYQGSLIGTTATQAVNNTGLYIASVVDSCGNSGVDSINVLAASGNANVWPGDMDFNGIVDHKDLPRFGRHIGEAGPSRINQDINWYPHPASDWGDTQLDGVDFKHLDSNGNGIIDLNDGAAVQANYNLTHNDAPATPPNLIGDDSPFQISLQPYITPQGISGSEEMIVNLVLENTSQNDLSFYGGYFTIFYDAPPNSINNVRLEFNNSWLGTEQELYYIAYNDLLNAKIDVGITRLDRANKIGSGVIAQLIFDIDQAEFSSTDLLDFIVGDISIHNSENIQLPIATQTTSFSFGSNDCPYDYLIDPNTVLNGEYQVANNISTNGFVNIFDNQNVQFKASQVLLNQSFNVENGAEFSVTIAPCSFNLKARNDDFNNENEISGFNYSTSSEELILNIELDESSDLLFEIFDFSGKIISKTDLGSQPSGKQQLSVLKEYLPQGAFVGGLVYNGKRHYFIVNN